MISNEPGISFVVPAYNEESGIGQTLDALHTTLVSLEMPFEIILVDDGSKDRTAEIAGSKEGVRVVSHPVNIGYGNTLKTGILHSKYDWVGITDADGTYPVEDIPRLVDEMNKGFNMVVGARSNLAEHDSFLKRIFRKLYKSSIEILTGHKIDDANSGFRIFEKRIVLEFFDFLCGTFSFTTGLSILAAEKPYFMKFIPIEYKDRKGNSKVRHFRDSLRTLQLIIQGVTYYNPLKFFLLLAVLMIFFVGFPAMVIAMLGMLTLSSYYMFFGCTVSALVGLGVLGDIIRVSVAKLSNENQNCTKSDRHG